MGNDAQGFFSTLLEQRPELLPCRDALEAAGVALKGCFRAGNKLLVCGNGGSAADTEHIVGELMKGFRRRRPIPETDIVRLETLYGSEGSQLGGRLQGALPAISLVSQVALATAITNDVSAEVVFAQQVYGYGRPGDALIAISTSGNALNVINAVRVARALDLRTIALTGERGALKELVEIPISVPGGDTARIQELHMAVYHALCATLEAELFPA